MAVGSLKELKNVEVHHEDYTMLYILPKEKALEFDLQPPKKIRLKPINKFSDYKKAFGLWSARKQNSIEFFERVAKYNPNVGAFLEDNTLVSFFEKNDRKDLPLLKSLYARVATTLRTALKQKNVEVSVDVSNRMYTLPKEKAVEFDVQSPKEICLKPITKFSDYEKAYEVWPSRKISSVKLIERVAKYNPNVGAFLDDTMVSWVFRFPSGLLMALQTDEKYFGKGYGQLVVKAISKQVACDWGHDICAGIFDQNVASKSLFGKLGFKPAPEKVHWLSTRKTWTDQEDDRNRAYADTLNPSHDNLFRLLQLIDYSTGYRFLGIRPEIHPILVEALRNANVEIMSDNVAILYHLPKEEALKFNVIPPEHVKLRSLTEMDDLEEVSKMWLHQDSCAVPYVHRLVKYNTQVDAFHNNTLVAWIFRLPIGLLGGLKTDKNHLGRGYGSLVTRALSKMIAELGDDIYSAVFLDNTPSHSLFKKLGFKPIGEVYFVATKINWTLAHE
ncbi:uncharacterized protein LOC116343668 [Contarinia nasturtii]|uniref:uncharacterized protein LOC116343668 n=1 Tax=Contarinia nasturtii TaxID=265458 RepID=UPI0012D3E842|nr:uncharacterized protein LOC116343668 [Contarinia nasturtii]